MWQKPTTLNESISLVGRPTVAVDEDVLEDILSVIDEDEFDQLDELSKKTLKSYLKKGEKSFDKHLMKSSDYQDKANDNPKHTRRERMGDRYAAKSAIHQDIANKRERGIGMAKKRLGIVLKMPAITRKDPTSKARNLTDVDFALSSRGTVLRHRKGPRQSQADADRERKQHVASKMKLYGRNPKYSSNEEYDYLEDLADIIEDLSDEELGYLDELSLKTLQSYKKKGMADYSKRERGLSSGGNWSTMKQYDDQARKVANRDRGTTRAFHKISALQRIKRMGKGEYPAKTGVKR